MAGRGRTVTFHGAFNLKRKAKAKERQVGGYIRRVKMKGGGVRFLVLKKKKKG